MRLLNPALLLLIALSSTYTLAIPTPGGGSGGAADPLVVEPASVKKPRLENAEFDALFAEVDNLTANPGSVKSQNPKQNTNSQLQFDQAMAELEKLTKNTSPNSKPIPAKGKNRVFSAEQEAEVDKLIAELSSTHPKNVPSNSITGSPLSSSGAPTGSTGSNSIIKPVSAASDKRVKWGAVKNPALEKLIAELGSMPQKDVLSNSIAGSSQGSTMTPQQSPSVNQGNVNNHPANPAIPSLQSIANVQQTTLLPHQISTTPNQMPQQTVASVPIASIQNQNAAQVQPTLTAHTQQIAGRTTQTSRNKVEVSPERAREVEKWREESARLGKLIADRKVEVSPERARQVKKWQEESAKLEKLIADRKAQGWPNQLHSSGTNNRLDNSHANNDEGSAPHSTSVISDHSHADDDESSFSQSAGGSSSSHHTTGHGHSETDSLIPRPQNNAQNQVTAPRRWYQWRPWSRTPQAPGANDQAASKPWYKWRPWSRTPQAPGTDDQTAPRRWYQWRPWSRKPQVNPDDSSVFPPAHQ